MKSTNNYHGEERDELHDEAKRPSSSIYHTLAWWWQIATVVASEDGCGWCVYVDEEVAAAKHFFSSDGGIEQRC